MYVCLTLVSLDVLVILIYPRNVHASDRFDQIRDLVDDLEHLASKLCCTNLTGAARYHCNLLGLRQRSRNLGGHLLNKEVMIQGKQLNNSQNTTFGNVSNSISTIAASRYSRQASAFFANCSASAFDLAAMANASASPRTLIYSKDVNCLAF